MVSLGFTGPAGVCHEDGGEKGGEVSGQREWLGEVTAAPCPESRGRRWGHRQTDFLLQSPRQYSLVVRTFGCPLRANIPLAPQGKSSGKPLSPRSPCQMLRQHFFLFV